MKRRQFIASSLSLAGGLITARQSSSASEVKFPPGFLWGAATASYQIEGAPRADGKGESIWDRFAHTPGAIKNNDNGDVACESYRRFTEDIALLKQLNAKTYRFSISWPRIQSTGRGAINQRGMDYYKRLVDALLDAGIRPLATLYHWDLPQALEDAGGWPNRDIARYFGEYASLVAKELGDKVKHWTVLNEPKTFTSCGYWYGIHAPGKRDPLAFVRSTHTANLALGHGFRAIKAAQSSAQVGCAFDVAPMYPFTQSPEDKAATERWHRFQNLWFVQPALTGKYPQVLPPEQEARLLNRRAGDEVDARAALDFVGLNYYTPVLVKNAPQGNGIPGLNTENVWATMHGTHPKMDNGWTIYPQGFYDILLTMSRVIGKLPIEITENGAAVNTAPDAAGKINDTARIEYLQGHLEAMRRAMDAGVNVRAYHCWSLLDNFEWAEGYSQRFGLVHVDFKTQKRTMKASGEWFARVAMRNAV